MVQLSIWRVLVLVLAVMPLGYYVVAMIAAVRFFGRERNRRLPEFTPPVSLLKPVRGVDFASYENFRSFCTQDYPNYEILFCVNETNDAAVPVIESLKKEFPEKRIEIFSGAPQIGSNRKVNNLAMLTQQAKHEILIQSDGDVRVRPEYIREVVAPFAEKAVGVVSCFYRGVTEANLWAKLEAVGAASDFLAGALVADLGGGVTFALGASVATTKTWLGKIGGYEALADVLADDYEIGNRVNKEGGKVLLSREPVWTMYPAQTVKSFWEHQVRWARTVRLVRPASFFGLIFTHGLPWAIAAALVAPTGWMAGAYLAGYAILRLAMAIVVGVWGLKDEVLPGSMWLIPFRDAIHFCVWVAGFTSNRVKWGGIEYEIRDGKMMVVES